MKYKEWLAWGTECLAKAGCPDAALDAWYLLEDCSGLSRSDYYLRMEEEVGETRFLSCYRERIEQRSRRIPLQYLTGTQEFMGLVFHVNEHVLIPRQDTELLVEHALKIIREQRRTGEPTEILDLCTGSGCILLSLLAFEPDCVGVGSDISEEALAVAMENANALGLAKRCRWKQSDLWEQIRGQYSLIVSNPPYIASRELEQLMPEVRDHEPRMALDGYEDGLFFYRKICERAKEHIRPGGSLLLEIGWDQSEDVTFLMEQAGFCEVETLRDYNGNDRVVWGHL